MEDKALLNESLGEVHRRLAMEQGAVAAWQDATTTFESKGMTAWAGQLAPRLQAARDALGHKSLPIK